MTTESLYGVGSRSPVPPRIRGHELPGQARPLEKQCIHCRLGAPKLEGRHVYDNAVFPCKAAA